YAAISRLAFRPDLASHQTHQLGGDGQAQSGAAVLAGGGAVGLFERLENRAQMTRLDSDTRVLHAETEGFLPSLERGRIHFDQNTSLAGELDRISDQVYEHLPQPARIAQQPVGNAGRQPVRQLESFLPGPDGERLHHLLETVAQPKLDRLQVEPAGLDLR